MCGIVGVTGRDDAARVLLQGLERLEYRGYDSAGLSLIDADGTASRFRVSGKVAQLIAAVDGDAPGAAGVAHTRWATHGPPVESNAHPHSWGRVHLVHNGIIENFRALRAEAESEGAAFTSQTDSEVVAWLFDRELAGSNDPREALRRTVDRLEGAFALGAVLEGDSETLLGARKGAPLLAGLGDGAVYLASDPLALAGEADTLIYLEDGDIVCARPGALELFDEAGAPVERARHAAQISPTLAEKGEFRHFMEKEIHEQPEVIGRTLSAYIDQVEGAVRAREGLDFAAVSRLIVVGCGTAALAGRIAEYWFAGLAGLPVKVDIASEFRYRDPAFIEGDLALFISQSGETADTLEALRLCKVAGVRTAALVNTAHSTMAREADIVLPTLAGPEIGVASTKAFTCQLAALACLAVRAGVERGRLSPEAAAAEASALMHVPGLVSAALHADAAVDTLARELAHAQTVLYLGRNQFFPMALEGALKLKEISYIHAEGYAAGELKHGPIALLEEGVSVVVIAPKDALFDKTRSSIEQVRARDAYVVAVTDEAGARELAGLADAVIAVPDAAGPAAAFTTAVAVQLLAYHIAVHKGTDVDQPRNLAKSVTVE